MGKEEAKEVVVEELRPAIVIEPGQQVSMTNEAQMARILLAGNMGNFILEIIGAKWLMRPIEVQGADVTWEFVHEVYDDDTLPRGAWRWTPDDGWTWKQHP